MLSIETKYLGATNMRGARIKAVTGNRHHSLTVSYDDALGSEAAHAAAAVALCQKLGWRAGELVAGSTRGGYVFVWIEGTRYQTAQEVK